MQNDNPKTVLLADAEEFVQVAYGNGLMQAGYKVITASDGDEALLMAQQFHPDLIVLDLIMPKTNGFDVLRSLQADAGLASIPVVVLTSLTQEHDETEARKYGAVDFMVKSDVSMQDVLAHITRILC